MLRINVKRPVVGVDFHTFDGIFQGSRSHLLGIFSEAVHRAPEIDFVLFLDDPKRLAAEHPEFDRSNVRFVRMSHMPGPIRLGVQLPWFQIRQKLDLLHTQYRLPFFPMGPCACTMHDVLFESNPEFFSKSFVMQSKLTFRFAASFARLLFTVSRFSRDEIVRRYGVSQDRIRILYNGVDRSRFFPGTVGANLLSNFGLVAGGYLLTVGRLEPRKNHARLIEAYAQLDDDAPPLVCIGQRDFGYQAAMESAAKFGVKDRVIFLENIDDGVLPVLMRNARVFVYPAIAEGFGMPVAEALASGVPVITSNTTSMPEIAGNAAVLVDPLSIESIAFGIKKVLGDAELSGNLIAAAAEQVQKFNWGESAQFLVASYRSFFSDRYEAPNSDLAEESA